MRHIRNLTLAAIMIAVFFFTGCSKVNRENYDKIKTGMTLSEVESVLGKGTETSGGSASIGDLTGSAKVITWNRDGTSITVTLVNDKVMTKSEEGL